MLIKQNSYQLKDGQKVIMRSLDLSDKDAFEHFFIELNQEQNGARSLVGDYKEKLSDLSIAIQNSKESPSDVLLGIFINEKIVAVCDFFDSTLESDILPIGEIGISVLQMYQNRGIASLAMKEVLDLVSSTKVAIVILTVVSSKKSALSVYKKLGFQTVSTFTNKKNELVYEMHYSVAK